MVNLWRHFSTYGGRDFLGSALVHPANGMYKEKLFEHRGLAPGCPQQALGEHRDGVALRGPCKPCSLCLRQVGAGLCEG